MLLGLARGGEGLGSGRRETLSTYINNVIIRKYQKGNHKVPKGVTRMYLRGHQNVPNASDHAIVFLGKAEYVHIYFGCNPNIG